jgi:putative ABC transport system permease protein
VMIAALATQALSDYDLGLSIPIPTLVGFTLVAILAGIGAAVAPARRASRLDVLKALQYQ